jgi:transposase InsO family protein
MKTRSMGNRRTPPTRFALAILDDHSRLCCHAQSYLSETAVDLVHRLPQAIQKRGLPRPLLTDNDPSMVAEERTEGLLRLRIVHERTLPYSPYQTESSKAGMAA